ncbi:MAG: hypothetical protein RLZZ450_1192 [Pseudomonadota bacterium]
MPDAQVDDAMTPCRMSSWWCISGSLISTSPTSMFTTSSTSYDSVRYIYIYATDTPTGASAPELWVSFIELRETR